MTAPYAPTPAVMAFKDLSLHGNVIPMAWYRQLTLANGKPNLPAIIILSDIVYWYRPVEVRDETTGHIIGYRAKFRADQLQRSYEQFADQFGLTKRQTKDAINYLLERGLITREFRSVAGSDGRLIGNVMFVAPIPPAILRINQLGNQHGEQRIEQAVSASPLSDDTAPEGPPSAIPSDDLSIQGDHPIDPPMTVERHTYTESTTQTSSSITPPPSPAASAADGDATAVAGGDDGDSPLADWLKREMGVVTAERFSAYPDAATRAYVQRLRDGGANAAMIAAELAKPATRRMLASTPPPPAPAPPPPPPEADTRRPAWISPEDWATLTSVQHEVYAGATLTADGHIEPAYPDLRTQVNERFRATTERLIQTYRPRSCA